MREADTANIPLNVTDWHYRDEGGANVVLAYDGSDPQLVQLRAISLERH